MVFWLYDHPDIASRVDYALHYESGERSELFRRERAADRVRLHGGFGGLLIVPLHLV